MKVEIKQSMPTLTVELSLVEAVLLWRICGSVAGISDGPTRKLATDPLYEEIGKRVRPYRIQLPTCPPTIMLDDDDEKKLAKWVESLEQMFWSKHAA